MQLQLVFRSSSSGKPKDRETSFFRKFTGMFTPPSSPPSTTSSAPEARQPQPKRRDSDDSSSSSSRSTRSARTLPLHARSSSTKTASPPPPARGLAHAKSLASLPKLSHSKSVACLPSPRSPSPGAPVSPPIVPRAPPAYACAFKDCWSEYCPTHNPMGSAKVAQARRVASMKSLRRLPTTSSTRASGEGASSSRPATGHASSNSSSGSSTSRPPSPPLPPSPPAIRIHYERTRDPSAQPAARPVSAPPSPTTPDRETMVAQLMMFPLPPPGTPVRAASMPRRPGAPPRRATTGTSGGRDGLDGGVAGQREATRGEAAPQSSASRRVDRQGEGGGVAAASRAVHDARRRPSTSSGASSRPVAPRSTTLPGPGPLTTLPPPAPSTTSSSRPPAQDRQRVSRSATTRPSTSSGIPSHPQHPQKTVTFDPAEPQPLRVVKRHKPSAASLSHTNLPSLSSAKDVEQALLEHRRMLGLSASRSHSAGTARARAEGTGGQGPMGLVGLERNAKRQRSGTISTSSQEALSGLGGLESHPYATAMPVGYAV